MKTKTYKVQIEQEQVASSPRQALVYAMDYIQDNTGEIVGLVTDPKGDKWEVDLAIDGPAKKVKSANLKPEDYFDSVELVTFLEMARLSGTTSTVVAEALDLSDEELDRLQGKLNKFLNP